MFGNQNMAMQLFPGAQQAAALCPLHTLICHGNFYTWCNINYHSLHCYYTCNYGYITQHGCQNYYTCQYHTVPPDACFMGTVPCVRTDQCLLSRDPCLISQDPFGPGGIGGDPVQVLQVLRQQLEVTLAGVRAQEAELQRQRAAAGEAGETQRGRGGRAARTEQSE
jgi:hypothetical protein